MFYTGVVSKCYLDAVHKYILIFYTVCIIFKKTGGRILNDDDYKTDNPYVTFQTPEQDKRSCQVRPEQGFKYVHGTRPKGILMTVTFFIGNHAILLMVVFTAAEQLNKNSQINTLARQLAVLGVLADKLNSSS